MGDLAGIERRLDHLSYLGVDALWLSPIYPSPLADFGYDVSDFTAIDPVFGTLADFERLVGSAHGRGLKVLMDLVPCHTSIEHRWFRDHPDWYVWADGRDGGPPNNWRATFGGSAWTYEERRGRWYLHSFYPEQPDLDWRNPEVVAAMQEVIRFWLDRGVDGYRVDAIERLLKDPELRDDPPGSEPLGLPIHEEYAGLALVNSRNAPDTGAALASIRDAAGDVFLAGEVYMPSVHWQPYLEHLDAVFAFELFHAPWDSARLRTAMAATASVESARGAGAAWVLSNHDFPRLPNRFGLENVRAAAMLLLTLPGAAFVYQGDEIGLADGPGGARPYDRAGRDAHRHPMQWDASPGGGFSEGEPWLPPVDPHERNVAAQRDDAESTLSFYRRLIELRRVLGGELELMEAAAGMIAYRRGEYAVAINTAREELPTPLEGDPMLETRAGVFRGGRLAPHSAVVVDTSG